MLQIPDYRNAVIVARNPGSAKKATSYAERLRLGIAVIHGEQKEAESDMVDGRYSPPPTLSRSRTMDVSVGVPVHPAKEKPPINVVGDVGGRIAIMVVSSHVLFLRCLSLSPVCSSLLIQRTFQTLYTL
jgi:phosphoribosylpyrophosphate synthetase